MALTSLDMAFGHSDEDVAAALERAGQPSTDADVEAWTPLLDFPSAQRAALGAQCAGAMDEDILIQADAAVENLAAQVRSILEVRRAASAQAESLRPAAASPRPRRHT